MPYKMFQERNPKNSEHCAKVINKITQTLDFVLFIYLLSNLNMFFIFQYKYISVKQKEMVFTTTLWACLLLGGSHHTALWGGGWALLCSVLWELTQGWPAGWRGSLECLVCSGLQVGPFCWLWWPEAAGKDQAHTGPVHNASPGVGSKGPDSTGPEQRGGNDSALCDAEKRYLGLDWDGPLEWCLECQQLHRARVKLEHTHYNERKGWKSSRARTGVL